MKSENHYLATVLERDAEVAWVRSAKPRDRCVLYQPRRSLAVMPDRLSAKDEAWGLVQCVTEVRWATSRSHGPRRRRHGLEKLEQLRAERMRRTDSLIGFLLKDLAPLYYKGYPPHVISDMLNRPEWAVVKAIELYILRGDLQVYSESIF